MNILSTLLIAELTADFVMKPLFAPALDHPEADLGATVTLWNKTGRLKGGGRSEDMAHDGAERPYGDGCGYGREGMEQPQVQVGPRVRDELVRGERVRPFRPGGDLTSGGVPGYRGDEGLAGYDRPAPPEGRDGLKGAWSKTEETSSGLWPMGVDPTERCAAGGKIRHDRGEIPVEPCPQARTRGRSHSDSGPQDVPTWTPCALPDRAEGELSDHAVRSVRSGGR